MGGDVWWGVDARRSPLAHLGELRARYGKGKTVAIDPAQDVVASGTLTDVQTQLRALGEPREDSDVVVFVLR